MTIETAIDLMLKEGRAIVYFRPDDTVVRYYRNADGNVVRHCDLSGAEVISKEKLRKEIEGKQIARNGYDIMLT